MDRRVALGLGAGLAGLALGVAAAVLGAELLAIAAGAAALVAATAALGLGAALRSRDDEQGRALAQMDALRSEIAHLEEAAEAGREAMRMAGTFAEMVALRNVELARKGDTTSKALTDEASGLLDGRYFLPALESRVASARRLLRPVSVVLLELDPPVAALTHDGDVADATLQAFSSVLRQTLREADTACRIGDTRFALILEDTPEGGGVWAAERIRAGFAREGGPVQLLSAGVASYPSHALEADELLSRVERALDRARATGRGQVEVAPVD